MKHIWKKEFIKINKIVAALLIVHVAYAVYHWLQIRNAFTVGVPISIWNDVISKNAILFSGFENLLLVSAIIVGIFQFYPEVSRKRFRISCHLPVNESLMIGSMLLFGIAVVTALWLVDVAGAYITARQFFFREMYSEVPLIMFYWYIKAIVLYALAAVVTLEPSWFMKAALALMLGGYYKLISVRTYNSDKIYILVVIILALIFVPAIYYPAIRFRKGA